VTGQEADLNNDGIPDLVVLDPTGRGVLIYQGRPGATYAAPLRVTVGFEPGAVAVGDLNGDGVKDLVVFDSTGERAVLLFGRDPATGQWSVARLGAPTSRNVADTVPAARVVLVTGGTNGSDLLRSAPRIISTLVPDTHLVLVPLLQSGVLQERPASSGLTGGPGDTSFAFVQVAEQPQPGGINRDGGSGSTAVDVLRAALPASSNVVSKALLAPATLSSGSTAGDPMEVTEATRQNEGGWESFRLGVAEALQKRLPSSQSEEGSDGSRDSSKTDLDRVKSGHELPTVTIDAPADQQPELHWEVPLETVSGVSLPDVPAEPPTSDAAQESEVDVFVRLDLLGIAALASTMVLGMNWEPEDA
jgi:hypothetical protein